MTLSNYPARPCFDDEIDWAVFFEPKPAPPQTRLLDQKFFSGKNRQQRFAVNEIETANSAAQDVAGRYTPRFFCSNQDLIGADAHLYRRFCRRGNPWNYQLGTHCGSDPADAARQGPNRARSL